MNKTYLFDFDGTLIDSYDSLVYVFEGAYNKVGVKVPEGYVLRLMRIQLIQGYKELHAPEDETSIKIFADEIVKLLDDKKTLELTKTYQEVKSTLYELKKRGYTLGIVTSNNKKHVREVLEAVDIDPSIFSIIIGNEETRKHKPNPDPILKALAVMNISKDNVYYVGDGLDDMTCAVNSEVAPILLDRNGEYSDLPYKIINTLDELL